MKKTNKTYHYVYRNGTVVDIIVSYDNPRGRSAFRVLSFYVLFLAVIFVGNKVYNVIKELNERIKYADTKEYISPIVSSLRVAEAGESAEIKETIKARASWYGVDDTGSRRGKDVLPLTGRNLQGNMVWWLAGMIITSVLYLGYLMAIKQLTWYAMIAVPLGNLVGFWIYLRILLNRSRL